MNEPWLELALSDSLWNCPSDSRIPMGGIDFRDAFRIAVGLWRPRCGWIPPEVIHDNFKIAYKQEYIEEIKSPRLTWLQGGDCDDYACFCSCVCKIPAILGYKNGRATHITNLYVWQDGYKHLDLTTQALAVNWDRYYRIKVFKTIPGLLEDVKILYGYHDIKLISCS